MNRALKVLLAWLLIAATCGTASADELRALFPLALESSLNVLLPQFEAAQGHKVRAAYGTIGALMTRLQNGEAADLAILSDTQIDRLQQSGKILPGTRADVALLGIGVFVRRGSVKHDISTPDALKRALTDSAAISYVDPASGAPSGIYVAGLIERLGISAEMKPKTRFAQPGPGTFLPVLSGEAELGFIQISEILAEPKVELVGPLPEPIQDYTKFAAGVVASGSRPEAARALIEFITSPAAMEVFQQKGFIRSSHAG